MLHLFKYQRAEDNTCLAALNVQHTRIRRTLTYTFTQVIQIDNMQVGTSPRRSSSLVSLKSSSVASLDEDETADLSRALTLRTIPDGHNSCKSTVLLLCSVYTNPRPLTPICPL